MIIRTESIKYYLEEYFNKSYADVKISDILLIENITIDSFSSDNQKYPVFFEDLKNFKNLRYLELCNIIIDDDFINNIMYLQYLENIIFRNCKFSDNIIFFDPSIKLKRIVIDSCYGFKFTYFSKVLTLKSICIKNSNFSSFYGIKNLKLNFLEVIGNCNIRNFCISYLCVNQFIISLHIYNKYSNNFTNYSSRVMICADEGYYIESQYENGLVVS